VIDLEYPSINMFNVERYDFETWVLLSSELPNRRPNAAHPLGRVDDIASAVDVTLNWYAQRDRAPLFKVTSLAPAGLTDELQRRGFEEVPGAVVYLLRDMGPTSGSALIETDPGSDWLDIVGIPAERRAMFGSAHQGDHLAWARLPGLSAGLAVVEGDTVGIFNMKTTANARRQGHGTLVLASLLGWAVAHGARRAFLQVVGNNQGAIALYRKMGFEAVYEYRYWTPQ